MATLSGHFHLLYQFQISSSCCSPERPEPPTVYLMPRVFICKPANASRISGMSLTLITILPLIVFASWAIKAKVGWISPLTSRRMLVNERGSRVLVASVEELAALVAQGRLGTAAAPRAFGEALAQVGERLRRATA